ncbi:TPA: type IV conjugative transfer system coupling protein TraD [Klebsiella quasipneumoniae subsp. quasipneumoniae]|jgi:conjugative coupling factor TraD (TOL family)|uniref:TraG-family protein n=2 Tax=Enterobacteriaceae TaxID=543 RepID=A0A486W0C2_KLEPN|nr:MULTISPECIES: type IV conjugative transfer system coupling protein TraD [Enterobacterales]ASA05750.1 conjugative coupling factor TraD, PFGI-1 class [Enterobacter cloacae complex sp.]EGS2004378.1 type IV conjugative transfer system coupling protein TraD [Enterobacter cloacae]EJH8728036.1 type IV conjugative transfer system coupling protein TraD [Cronobacter sakazakii]MBU5538317.1 type IV conjugative transfer system coupling protein TraD [Pluralibacter sp. S10_ASV_43]MBU5649478.1 type IV conj
MSNRYVIEALLRPAVELNTAVVSGMAAYVCVQAPWAVALAPSVSYVTAAGFAALAVTRTHQGMKIIRYRRNLRRLPRYVMSTKQIPVSHRRLFLGRGFRWTQKHTQRLQDTLRPEVARYLQPNRFYLGARQLEMMTEHRLPWLGKLLSADTPLNPVRPLPPVGGNPALHGIEPDEKDVTLALGERVGHTVVYGTTRVGKTRLAELLVTQDIRRGEVTIVFDPKGDADLMKRVWAEAHRAGRGDELYIFHLGWPEISARYNAVGRFGRVSEVASRVAGQLSGEGNSAAFREFAWRFVNIIARALVALGERPDYTLIMRYVNNIADLYIRYAEKIIQAQLPALQTQIENNQQVLGEDDVPRNMQGQPDALRIWAIEVALSSEEGKKLYDPILDGLRSAVRYDRTYFDKIVASLLPLLEKLTTGKTAELLSPDYQDIDDTRPIFDWEQIIRKKAVVYVGLDALSDSEVASAVGNSMFADLVSVAGHIYKHGINAGLPGGKEGKSLINLHCDEFNELMGDEFIPLINKGGGAGMQVTAYTQTSSDIEARIGNAAKTAQVQGNFNNLIMLRVRENRTAELLTTQLPQVEIYTKTLVSGHQDTADVNADQDFTSSTQDRVGTVKVPLLEPADIVTLPKGQAFALLEGGQLWKIRMPLPAGDADDVLMPESIEKIAEEMRRSYHSGESWWRDGPALNVPVTGGANG